MAIRNLDFFYGDNRALKGINLDLPDPETAPTRTVKLWQHTFAAYDGDSVTRQWFSQYLGVSCQLVRFHPDAHHAVRCLSISDQRLLQEIVSDAQIHALATQRQPMLGMG